MRSSIFLLFFILFQSFWGQNSLKIVNDSLPEIQSLIENEKDSISKHFIPYIKPMDEVTVEDYKILHFDNTETTVDTTLSLKGEYTFNFLRKDYFELLPLPNMGEGFNKMGYDFQTDPLTPQMGARVKHFGYF